VSLLEVDIRQFRCLERAPLNFDPDITLIFGDNGAGKTSILEAIHVLSTGRSFRTQDMNALVRDGKNGFCVNAILEDSIQNKITVSVSCAQASRVTVRSAERKMRGFGELAALLPTLIIDQTLHTLIAGGPGDRRRFLDRGVFHVEHSFLVDWRQYQRILQQRNAAIRTRVSEREIRSWDQDLAEMGERIAAKRQRYVDRLRIPAAEFCRELLKTNIELKLQQGWGGHLSLAEALREAWLKDNARGFTTVGPHRAELETSVDGIPASERVSRGQQKLLAVALVLAQLKLSSEMNPHNTCLLVDDPTAELDVDNFELVLHAIGQAPGQKVVTAPDQRLKSIFPHAKMFHVKHGCVNPLV
jgi:DNA replication and repair protein RecF